MSETIFPTDSETLSANWLAGALGVSVQGRSIKRIGEAEGFTGGALFLVTPHYSNPIADAPKTLVAKLSPVEPEMRRTFAAANRREVEFYLNFSAGHDLQVPDCFYGAFEPESGASILLMEDLSHARRGDFIKGSSLQDAQSTIDAMAEIHAQLWDLPEVHALSGAAILEEFDFASAWARYPEKLAAILPDTSLPASFVLLGDFLVDKTSDLLTELLEDGPVTCLHRDLQTDNLRFRPTDGRAILLDWQIRGKGRGVYDLSYFLVSSLEPDLRRAHEQDLLRRYHTSLSQHGVRDYDLEVCQKEYIKSVIGKFYMTVVATALLDNSTPHKQAWRKADLFRLLAFCEDHDVTPATFA